MANLFDNVIHDFREANGGEDDELIRTLVAKKEELGEDASEEEVMEAVREILTSRLRTLISGEEEDVTLDKEDGEYLEKAKAAVKAFLDSNNMHYSENRLRADLYAFEVMISHRGCRLPVRIIVEADPRVCRIDARIPVSADPAYEYPLAARILQENFTKRFGSLQYDSRFGEMLYAYSFLARNGIDPEDLDILFHTIASSAVSYWEVLKRLAVGKFKPSELQEILEKTGTLIQDLKES